MNNKNNNFFKVFKQKKENFSRSLFEVECFLKKYKKISKSIHLYKILKH